MHLYAFMEKNQSTDALALYRILRCAEQPSGYCVDAAYKTCGGRFFWPIVKVRRIYTRFSQMETTEREKYMESNKSQPPGLNYRYSALLRKGSSYFTASAAGDSPQDAVRYLKDTYPDHTVCRLHPGQTLVGTYPENSLVFNDVIL